MIAITIFSVFVAAYLTVQGDNIGDSIRYNQELVLHQMCMGKLNELMNEPPEFKDALTLTPDIKTDEHNSNYEYTIEYKRFELPDLNKIQGKSDDDTTSDNPMFKMIYDRMRTNIKEMIWQIRVTVKDKSSGAVYSLSTWLNNPKSKVNLGI